MADQQLIVLPSQAAGRARGARCRLPAASRLPTSLTPRTSMPNRKPPTPISVSRRASIVKINKPQSEATECGGMGSLAPGPLAGLPTCGVEGFYTPTRIGRRGFGGFPAVVGRLANLPPENARDSRPGRLANRPYDPVNSSQRGPPVLRSAALPVRRRPCPQSGRKGRPRSILS